MAALVNPPTDTVVHAARYSTASLKSVSQLATPLERASLPPHPLPLPTSAGHVDTLVQVAEVFLAAEAMQANRHHPTKSPADLLYCPMGACTSRFATRTTFEEHMKSAHLDMYKVICLQTRPSPAATTFAAPAPAQSRLSAQPAVREKKPAGGTSVRGRRKRPATGAAKAAPYSAGYSDRYRKSVLFNSLKMGDLVRIRSNNRLNHRVGIVASIPVYPNTWRDIQLRESGELVKVRSSNIVPLAAPDDWDPEDMDDTSLSSSSPAVSFSMADALPAVPLALHHPGFDANVSAAAPVVPPPVTYGGELPTFQLQDAQQGHAASPIQQQHLPWQKTNGDVGLSTAS